MDHDKNEQRQELKIMHQAVVGKQIPILTGNY